MTTEQHHINTLNRAVSSIDKFNKLYPNEKPVLRVGSGRVIVQSDKHTLEG